MACVSVLALLCGHTQIPLIPHLSDHHRAENAEHRRSGNGEPGLSERVRTTSNSVCQKWNLGTMKILRCDSSSNSIATASRPGKAAMQRCKQYPRFVSMAIAGLSIWRRIPSGPTDF
jgi:hypothetical protein